MPAGRGGQKQAIADGNLILPTGFRTFCHVNIFRHTFCFRLKRLYLCISKGSAGVLPFFVFFPLQMTIRPKQSCRTASFTLPLGPSELPSVALLDDRLGRMRILMGRMRKTRRIKTGGRMGVEKSRVSLFRNLGKFRAILWYCSPCSDPQPPNLGGLSYLCPARPSPPSEGLGEAYSHFY